MVLVLMLLLCSIWRRSFRPIYCIVFAPQSPLFLTFFPSSFSPSLFFSSSFPFFSLASLSPAFFYPLPQYICNFRQINDLFGEDEIQEIDRSTVNKRIVGFLVAEREPLTRLLEDKVLSMVDFVKANIP
jgi:hypothetical protein